VWNRSGRRELSWDRSATRAIPDHLVAGRFGEPPAPLVSIVDEPDQNAGPGVHRGLQRRFVQSPAHSLGLAARYDADPDALNRGIGTPREVSQDRGCDRAGIVLGKPSNLAATTGPNRVVTLTEDFGGLCVVRRGNGSHGRRRRVVGLNRDGTNDRGSTLVMESQQTRKDPETLQEAVAARHERTGS
jgi:hypothetical protein